MEPQTYRITLAISEAARRQMRGHDVVIGLAPGGIAKLWAVKDAKQAPSEIMCAHGEVEPLGPDQGKSDGRYEGLECNYRMVMEEAIEYVEKNGIPYDSWKCNGHYPGG